MFAEHRNLFLAGRRDIGESQRTSVFSRRQVVAGFKSCQLDRRTSRLEKVSENPEPLLFIRPRGMHSNRYSNALLTRRHRLARALRVSVGYCLYFLGVSSAAMFSNSDNSRRSCSANPLGTVYASLRNSTAYLCISRRRCASIVGIILSSLGEPSVAPHRGYAEV